MATPDYSTEEWRDIPGFEGRYEVSSLGRVRKSAQILKPWFNSTTGYWYVGLGRAWRGTVHRLVCRVFHGAPPSEKAVVAHWDGDRQNNRPSNLRWATWSENLQDAIRHGTSKLIQYRTDGHKPRRSQRRLCGEASSQAKLTYAAACAIRQRHSAGETMQSLADEFSVSKSTVFRTVRGISWGAAPTV